MVEQHLEIFIKNYSPTTSWELDTFFNMYVKQARDVYCGLLNKNLNELKKAFVTALERTIHGDLQESDGIANTHLRHIFSIANRDWNLDTVNRFIHHIIK